MLGPLTFWSLIISAVYLFYLAAFSSMTIWHDSLGYEHLGNILASGHWNAYFVHGPNREPFYSALVALAMVIAKNLSVPYTSIVMIIQVFLLLGTQMLMVLTMNRFKVRDGLQALAVVYAAFSPSLTNFTFILWSDFTPALFILGGVLMYFACWKAVTQGALGRGKMALYAAALAAILSLLTLLKAAFEMITFLIILSFLAAIPAVRKNHDGLVKWAVFILTLIVCYQGVINAYKGINPERIITADLVARFNHEIVIGLRQLVFGFSHPDAKRFLFFRSRLRLLTKSSAHMGYLLLPCKCFFKIIFAGLFYFLSENVWGTGSGSAEFIRSCPQFGTKVIF